MKKSLADSKVPRKKFRPWVSSHIYKRGDFYYFRARFPAKYRERFGQEIRLSLMTPYRQKALELSGKLYSDLQSLLDDPEMDLKELRLRLNRNIQMKLEEDTVNLSPRSPSSLYTGIEAEHPEYSYADTCKHIIKQLLNDINNEDSLSSWSKEVMPTLEKVGIINQSQADNASIIDKLIATKLFLESEVKYITILLNRAEGNFFGEENIVLNNFDKSENYNNRTFTTNEFIKELVNPKDDTLSQLFNLLNSNIKIENSQPVNSSQSQINVDIETKTQSILYSVALSQFVTNKVTENRWKKHLVDAHRSDLQLFIKIMGDIPITSIDRTVMRQYRDTLLKLPPNFSRNKLYKDKSIEEILKITHKKVLSSKRVNYLVQAVGSLLDWCQVEGFIQFNPVKKLQIIDTRQAIDLRDPFETSDLDLIFSHPKYKNAQFKSPAYFWIPLIGLFTGMRAEEISQLYTKDIYKKKGIWIIDINAEGVDAYGYPKTLKNKNAVRLVPVHHTLIDLGFIDYCRNISDRNIIRLFSELRKTEKTGKYGKQPTKRFSDLIKQALNVENHTFEKKSFHSLRHTFADFYKQNGLQDNAFRQLYGHEIPELAQNTYGSRFPAEKLNEIIEKLDYGIDLSHLKNSKYINPII
jgi:integrase